MDIVVPLLFVLIVSIYFYLSSKANVIPSQEITTVGIFCLNSVAYCFLFGSQNGFVSIYETFNQMAYMILVYAGTTKTISLLQQLNKEQEAKKIYYKFIIISFVYILIEMISTKLALSFQSNIPMIVVFLMCPIYTHIMFVLNIISIKRNKLYYSENRFQWMRFLTSFTTVSFSISIYEWADLHYLIKYIDIYKDYKTIHKDPTLFGDTIWLAFNIIFLLVLPRIYYLRKKKGAENEINHY